MGVKWAWKQNRNVQRTIPHKLPSIQRGGQEYIALKSVLAPLGANFSSPDARSLKICMGPAVVDFTQDGTYFLYNGCKIFLNAPFFWEKQQLYITKNDFVSKIEPLLHPQRIASAIPSLKTIVLDAGHGGNDAGTSARGISEKVWTLDVVKHVKERLEQLNYRVVLTRDQDRYVSLLHRVEKAREVKANIFVSIHFNACKNSNASGCEIFVPFTGIFSPWNIILAYDISSNIKKLSSDFRGIKLGNFYVLRRTGSLCSSILIEVGFMTNGRDFSYYVDPSNRKKFADAVADGIQRYEANLKRIRH
jgi:N-acetylmuramoyl-L-alanine amidase